MRKILCFLTNHDLVVYRHYSPKLHCKRCCDPWSDTLWDKLQRWNRQRQLPVKPTDDEIPF